jgi:DNA (cytosine-5)-methyltransferase 1
MNSITNISLFCGAGGLDCGLHLAGIDTVVANDNDKHSIQTLKNNYPNTITHLGDIAKLDIATLPETDLITGGFPCQGFSLAGPRKIDDSRNRLYHHFVGIVKHKQPKMFLGENVKGLLTLGDGEIFKAIVEDFSNAGYLLTYRVVNAKNYGVAQDRERIILVGFRKDIWSKTPRFELEMQTEQYLKDLDIHGKVDMADVCQQPFSPRYMSRNRKRDWNEFSFTIPATAKQVPLHPSSDDMKKIEKDKWIFGKGKTRRFSWHEASLIQGFPSDYIWSGDINSRYKQIGNAVPVLLAKQIGLSVVKLLNDIE